MDLNEALGKITDPEVKAFFEKMVKDQNSYITKLENQLKEQPKPQPVGNDDVTKAYIQKKMREEVYEKAVAKIIDAVGKDVFVAVQPDFNDFLEKNMKLENTKEDYVLEAFNLVYGRCLTNKAHPIHQVGKAVNPNGTPTPQAPGTNGAQMGVVQNIVAGQPPVMTQNDTNAGQGIPGTQGEPIKNTREAFTKLRERFQNNGGNKFQ